MGKAVLRNRIKRVLREMCRENLDQFPSGYDIIFIARQKIKGINQHLIEVKLLQLLEKAGKKSGAFK